MTEVHEISIEDLAAAADYYDRNISLNHTVPYVQLNSYPIAWPNYCRKCNGFGAAFEKYDPSPAGIGLSPGYMVESHLCSECVERGKCPRCGKELDDDCPLDYVTNGAESLDLNAAMSNSFGFGGGNACLIIKKYQNNLKNH